MSGSVSPVNRPDLLNLKPTEEIDDTCEPSELDIQRNVAGAFKTRNSDRRWDLTDL
jgi:hypothetical protein